MPEFLQAATLETLTSGLAGGGLRLDCDGSVVPDRDLRPIGSTRIYDPPEIEGEIHHRFDTLRHAARRA
jgi:hypothetical protein